MLKLKNKTLSHKTVHNKLIIMPIQRTVNGQQIGHQCLRALFLHSNS